MNRRRPDFPQSATPLSDEAMLDAVKAARPAEPDTAICDGCASTGGMLEHHAWCRVGHLELRNHVLLGHTIREVVAGDDDPRGTYQVGYEHGATATKLKSVSREAYLDVEAERDVARQAARDATQTTWMWQSDGSNDLDSMGDGMLVTMTAATVRGLLAPVAPPVSSSQRALLERAAGIAAERERCAQLIAAAYAEIENVLVQDADDESRLESAREFLS